ncbi:hypothetical protein H6G76_28695 [Nostoc sp. FACHB-152]|uniref:hypothetical protein n=1 Tax=unclassified Nostoc TaxID=2593658 RepID=UPI00168542C5|nr:MULTISPECIES: hypothetical protein [unclassified Nostoc]MBD2451037.1 hypothetical protein [Nostoc sp. FACHB-152]MBD2471075.1 hypothetical protein [Nostoc sp. FACHB-145]
MQSTFFIALRPDEEANISGGGSTNPSTSDAKEAALDKLATKSAIFYKRNGTYVVPTGKTIIAKDSNVKIIPEKNDGTYNVKDLIGKNSLVRLEVGSPT